MASLIKNQMYVNDGGSSRPSAQSLVYDPKTGQWVPSTATSTSSTSSGVPSLDKKGDSKDDTSPSTKKSGDSSSNVDTKKEAEKEYIEAEFNILTGEMRLTPTTKSIRIKVNDTVKIAGLGKYLSGLYFVSAISRKIDVSSGYTHSLTLIKNGFGSSVKESLDTETRKDEVVKEAPEYKVGDFVKIVGEDAIYSKAHEGVKVPEWVKGETLTIQQISDDKTKVLLMPIFSWTYVKYIQKL